MIKVLHVVLGLQVGGLEKFVLDLIKTYSDNIKPFIVCLENSGELAIQYKDIDIVELKKTPGIKFQLVGQLRSLIKELGIDIIHTHNPSPHFYGAVAGFLTNRPVIHTKHGRNYPSAWKKVLLNRISSFLSNKIVAVSQNAADVCSEIENIPKSKVAVVLNGINTELYCPPSISHASVRMPVRVGIVARLSAEKDHQTLLSACELLVSKTTNFHLEIIGDGPLRHVLEKSVRTLGIETFVSFAGTRHDVPDVLRQLDIFVLSSTTEGISLTLLEAMATGLPVVATDVGGNPEVVVDGMTGYLVPPRNPDEIANKLLSLIDNKNLRKQMGVKGRERVVTKFSIQETARQYEELYCSVINKG